MKVVAFLFALLSIPAMADDRVSMVFNDAHLVDLARVTFGEIARQPFILSHEVLEARELIAVDLRNIERTKLIASVRQLVEASGFSVETRSGVVWIGKQQEREEVIIYRPRHRSARYLSDVVQTVTGARSVQARAVRNPETQQAAPGREGPQAQQPQKQTSLTSVEGQVDRSEVDQIAFTVPAKDAQKVKNLLADLDTPVGEVVLKAAVYEVGIDKREGSAVKLAASILGGRLGASISGNVFDGVSVKIAQGGIDAVLSALDADARFKSVSRPQVRVRNGAQARFSVGQDVPVLGAAQTDKNGNPVQSVDYKQSGIILTASPEIREEVIELNLQQELSNFVVTKTGVNNSPTLIKRAVNTRLGLVPGEVVVLAGLQDDQQDSSESRMPFVGWLLGHERQSRQSEILVFIEAQRI